MNRAGARWQGYCRRFAAGAIYGANAIPGEWKSKLAMREMIERFAMRLMELRGTIDAVE